MLMLQILYCHFDHVSDLQNISLVFLHRSTFEGNTKFQKYLTKLNIRIQLIIYAVVISNRSLSNSAIFP